MVQSTWHQQRQATSPLCEQWISLHKSKQIHWRKIDSMFYYLQAKAVLVKVWVKKYHKSTF